MNAHARLFGHDPLALDKAIYRIAMRSVNRVRVRELVSIARAAIDRLETRGIYSDECWAYEEDAREKTAEAIEAFNLRNEV